MSDGSTDGTLETVGKFVHARHLDASLVRLIEVPAGGKPLALNAGVNASSGEILVFADARQRFSTTALLELVANFADSRVGGVTGELMLDCDSAATLTRAWATVWASTGSTRNG